MPQLHLQVVIRRIGVYGETNERWDASIDDENDGDIDDDDDDDEKDSDNDNGDDEGDQFDPGAVVIRLWSCFIIKQRSPHLAELLMCCELSDITWVDCQVSPGNALSNPLTDLLTLKRPLTTPSNSYC